jgi:NitT/TauT family transport system ATP-binding protein
MTSEAAVSPKPMAASANHMKSGTKADLAARAPLVTLRNIDKTFANGTHALDNVSFEVRQGDFLSLVGPSGCGKSTALRLISKLTAPTSGRIDWHGGAPAAGDIAFVFQEATLMPWATVWDNAYLPLKLKGVSKGEAAPLIEEALTRVNLLKFANSYPRELSGGMKMRCSIARALVMRPKILLMDEPFAALDEITRFRLNNDLLELWQTYDWTVIFVTHSVFESVFLSNRIVVMSPNPGRVFKEIDVSAGYPRDEMFRTSPEYAANCRIASDALEAAMHVGPASFGAHL